MKFGNNFCKYFFTTKFVSIFYEKNFKTKFTRNEFFLFVLIPSLNASCLIKCLNNYSFDYRVPQLLSVVSMRFQFNCNKAPPHFLFNSTIQLHQKIINLLENSKPLIEYTIRKLFF